VASQDGDLCLGGVFRQQVGDGGHRAFVVECHGFGGVVGWWREIGAEVGVDRAE
jgi:hypothetical protein